MQTSGSFSLYDDLFSTHHNICNADMDLRHGLSGPSKAQRASSLERLLNGEHRGDLQVIQILRDIDGVPVTITNYRDRERHLESLMKILCGHDNRSTEEDHICSFHYLLGSFYVNFEKFWGPNLRVTIELLEKSSHRKQLFKNLLEHLKHTNSHIYNEVDPESRMAPADVAAERPDHVLHRNFMFQILSKFSHLVENDSVPFMDEFLRFVHHELLVSPFIEKNTTVDLTSIEKNNTEVTNETDGEIHHDAKTKRRRGKVLTESVIQKRKSRETFITAAKVIQSFSNIERVHRQDELKSLLLDLLCCRDSSIQKSAFNCYLAYKNDSIHLYKDRLLKILNDKKVRNELSVFSIDAEESDQVQQEHRPVLVPVLQRILFGRMVGQVGRKSSGHKKADLRKTLIMRFIAGCTEEEVTFFFQLLFDSLFDYIDVPYDRLPATLSKDLDMKKYIPLNKIQAMLSSLTAYMESVAHLKSQTLRYVLKLLNIITFLTVRPLDDQELLGQLCSKSIELLRIIRRECINVMAEYFKSFTYYTYAQSEIDFIFNYLVWPASQEFVDRNHASVTPILRLIESFASDRVYHTLMVKRDKCNNDRYLLDHVITLYCDLKTERHVLKFLANIICYLLRPEKDLDEEELEIFHKNNHLQALIDKDAKIPIYDPQSLQLTNNLLPPGHAMVIGYTRKIFDRMQRLCLDLFEKKDTSLRLTSDELEILSVLSGYSIDSEQSLIATRLLLSTLNHQKKESLIIETLKTATKLMQFVKRNTDTTIVRSIADFLYYQRNTEQRREICKFIATLSDNDSNLSQISQAIQLLNSTSSEFIESPDLVKWNEGFQICFRYLDSLDEDSMNNVSQVEDSFVLMIHQAMFIVNSIDHYEFSIKENVANLFIKISERLRLVDASKNPIFLRDVLDEMLLKKFIKKGLRSTNESVRNVHIDMLRNFALNCHQKNKTLSEFNLFCNSQQDLDFWQNIKHIQIHNRSKALSRLVNDENLKKLSPKTLSSYFMPIASGFLFNKNYRSIASITENSIKLIALICRNLNWATYESTLSYYLNMLTKASTVYQKTNIKLITEILKNFNFDLSAFEEAMQHEAENAKIERRLKKRLSSRSGGSVEESTINQKKKLNASTAKMVYSHIFKRLIPRLNSCLQEMTRVEYEHDKNMSNYAPEKDEIKRIPIAYAIVQLLNLLPGKFILFRDHLPGLFLKLASFLKSKNEDTRKAARMTLVKIMNFVGPMYFPDLLRILRQNLDKGFQVHVLNYSLHSVLDKMDICHGELDTVINDMVEQCMKEIFGRVAEDKEVAKILAKTSEAKKTKSYDSLMILATYVSPETLDDLVNPIKNSLKTATDSRKVNKLSVCIQRIFTGLSHNNDFPLDQLLFFIKSIIEESIPSLRVRQKLDVPINQNKENEWNALKVLTREDRYIIGKDPTKERVASKINEKGNLHMLVENALRLLLMILETNKNHIRSDEALQLKLDIFIELLTKCLKSSSTRCVMRSLKCIFFIAKTRIDLKSFKTKSDSIMKKIFILLSLYNGVGMVKGDNFEMISMCFKTLSYLLLHCQHVQINTEQMRALMSYIEQDLNDSTRQITAFKSLYSLLKRKCETPELPETMNKVAHLLVTSDDGKVRTVSTQLWQIYLLHYKHDAKTLQDYLTRFLRQIDYEHIDGRLSVLRMLRMIIEKFPERLLRDYHELFFHLLAQRVVNDDSKDVRAMVGRLIALLLQRLPDKQVYMLNKFVTNWLRHGDASIKLLGIKLTSIFIEANKELFRDRDRMSKTLKAIHDTLELKIETGQIVHNETESNDGYDAGEVTESITLSDRLNYHALRVFKRLLDYELVTCVETRLLSELKEIWKSISTEKLNHRHEPIVATSCELYWIFLTKTDLANSLANSNPSIENYLDWNATRIVRTLCDNYIQLIDRFGPRSRVFRFSLESMIAIGQFVTNSLATVEFESQYTKNFVDGDILNHLLSSEDLPKDGFVHDYWPYSLNEAKKKATLAWMAIKVTMQARKEAALHRLSEYHRRDFVLKWTASVAQTLGSSRVLPYVTLFLMTPAREITDKTRTSAAPDQSRNTLAMSEDLLKFLKALIGVEKFNLIYPKVQLHYARRRLDRKKTEALNKVKDQTRGVKRKIKQRQQKDKRRRVNKTKEFRNKRLRA